MKLRDYYDRVARLGCCVTRSFDGVTLHHVHGGSVARWAPRGLSLRHEWLVIPLVADLHAVGPDAIDGEIGVMHWEARFGRQLDYLRWVQDRTGIDAFARQGLLNPWETHENS